MQTLMRKSKKRLLLLSTTIVIALIAVTLVLNWQALVREYRFWQAFEFIEVNSQGYKEYRHLPSDIRMVLLPGGEFMMGSPQEEKGRTDEEALHKVKLSPYLIAKYEVSQKIWEKVMGSLPFENKKENHPIVSITWEECQEFCRKTGLQLPTEAQWEYACRGSTSTPYSLGDTINHSQVNYFKGRKMRTRRVIAAINKTMPVDSFQPNDFGLYNMHGNVHEYCADIYNREYYSLPQAKDGDHACDIPTTGKTLTYVIRGGGWMSQAVNCRSAKRSNFKAINKSNGLGFRPVYIR